MGKLEGRVAMVTGAGSGLGRAMACCLAREGAAVVITARRRAKLEETASAIRDAGGKVLVHELDLRDAGAIPLAFDAAEAALGPVDTLVNNAGVVEGDYAARVPLETIDSVIDTNFRAPFLTSTELARRTMARDERAWIVNISSIGAFHYSHHSLAALYAGTKSGIMRLTEALALEWAAHKINVNAIAPGIFISEITQGLFEHSGAEMVKAFPRQRFGNPQDLDSTLLYLVDEGSHMVTGATIIIDDAQQPR